ncbi:MAG: thiamine phosphate synthase [Gemmatimonadota bacterium]
MRPLPRLHAVTDAGVLARDDFGIQAAAIAAGGASVALHARDRTASAVRLTAVTERLMALSRPPEASVFVNARPDIAAALGAQGTQLGGSDLPPNEVRAAFSRSWRGWIGSSVHSVEEATRARDEGADYLLVGSIFETASHPGQRAVGPGLIAAIARLRLPVIAIGGMTVERAVVVRDAGAYGLAAISALWNAGDPAAAALALLAPWMEEA